MRIKYIAPIRVKVLMMMFFGTGAMGIIIGLSTIAPAGNIKIILTLMGVVNIGLCAFFTFTYLTQTRKEPDKRKKKKKQD